MMGRHCGLGPRNEGVPGIIIQGLRNLRVSAKNLMRSGDKTGL